MDYFLVQLRKVNEDSRDQGFKWADQTVEEKNKCPLKRGIYAASNLGD
ncbi:MAG TPA: hypothetical protein VMT12_05185 [Syntrophales bacterium]|nr:hypothetical protein [Syntrophales bacterium]